MSIAHLRNRRMTVFRQQTTREPGGGQSVDWVDQRRTVRVQLSQPSPAERQTAAQSGVEMTHVGYWLAGEDLHRGDRLVDGDLTVEIVSMVKPSDPRFVRAQCREEPWRA